MGILGTLALWSLRPSFWARGVGSVALMLWSVREGSGRRQGRGMRQRCEQAEGEPLTDFLRGCGACGSCETAPRRWPH